MATFLHLTDAHLSFKGVPHKRDDHKTVVPDLPQQTREARFNELFARLCEHLADHAMTLDAVVFTGDAQARGAAGGHEVVLDLLIKHLGPFGIDATRIVATPGNHDIPIGTSPGTLARYKSFNDVWRAAGCVVPWMDGVDPSDLPQTSYDQHRLVAADKSWAIFPFNSSNWSHTASILPKPLADHWDKIGSTLSPNDAEVAEAISRQLDSLARYDMARLSNQQLEVMRLLMKRTERGDNDRQLRIAVLHHHLRSPSLREELKPHADISNLEQVRAALRNGQIDLLLHGHKHEHAATFDDIYGADHLTHQRMLVVSGATFEPGRETDAMRIISVGGLPFTPEIEIVPLPLPRAGAEWKPGAPERRSLWLREFVPDAPIAVAAGAPVVIYAKDLDEAYARARAAADDIAKRGLLIVHLDLPHSEVLPLPKAYHMPKGHEDKRDVWLKDLVEWWQRDRSHLERRISYVHGGRLRRYAGKIDQIERVISLLRVQDSTRAIAVLIDPVRDFLPDPTQEKFASFCLVEFRRRKVGAATFVDAVAFYRAQEITKWWPVNVAELRFLQIEISRALRFQSGTITTIAADARTISPSPTQVAMPIVDRWLDQAPERLHLLADALAYQSVRDGKQTTVVAEWRLMLAEQREAWGAFNPDGIPLSTDGLQILALYLEAHAGDEEVLLLAMKLKDLASHHETYLAGQQTHKDFTRASDWALRHLDEIDRLTDARLTTT